MSAAEKFHLTPNDYLATERASDLRHEYVVGQVFAMAGGSSNHSLIAMNLAVAIGRQLVGSTCRLYTSDLKVGVVESDLYSYPDLSGLCGTPRFLDEKKDVLVNPSLIVEVLSPSTEAYDRGAKFAHYRQMPSMREYVLVSQDEMRIEIFTAGEDGSWTFREYREPEAEVPLVAVSVRLRLCDAYRLVEFQP